MNMHINTSKIKTQGVTRRNMLRAAPAAVLAMTATGAAASAGDDQMSAAEQIKRHVAEIERLLIEAAPSNVEVKSICWRVGDNDFWASGAWTDPNNSNFYKLAHFRPQHQPDWWIQQPPTIGA